MSLPSGVGLTSQDMSLRLRLLSVFPAALTTALIYAVLASGAPSAAPSSHALRASLDSLGWRQIAVASLALVVVAMLLQPLELAAIRLLEGYWGNNRLLRPLAEHGLWLHRRRRAMLRLRIESGAGPLEKRNAAEARKQLALYPLDPADLLPTLLGNRLRAAEEVPGRRYGLNALVLFPHLYAIMPASTTAWLDDLRNQLDVAVRLALAFATTGVVISVLLARYGWWLALPAALLLLSWLSYRAAAVAAIRYGAAVVAAFDLHRFELIKTFRRPLPEGSDQERKRNAELMAFLGGESRLDLRYDHSAGDGKSSDPASSE